MKLKAAEWNRRYPVGTPVRYHPVGIDLSKEGILDTVTRSEAWDLEQAGGRTITLVSIKGKSGGVGVAWLTLIQTHLLDEITCLMEQMRVQEGWPQMTLTYMTTINAQPSVSFTASIPHDDGTVIPVIKTMTLDDFRAITDIKAWLKENLLGKIVTISSGPIAFRREVLGEFTPMEHAEPGSVEPSNSITTD